MLSTYYSGLKHQIVHLTKFVYLKITQLKNELLKIVSPRVVGIRIESKITLKFNIHFH